MSSYFLANLIRVSPGVVMPPLAASMGMNAAVVGLISSLYFYAYTMIQPYSGSICDKKGPLLACGSGLFIMAFGIALFAIANTPFQLGVGRLLSGLGAGATFNGVLVFQANAFTKESYPFFAGFSLTLGNLGGVVAVAPLGILLDRWGHCSSFLFLALCTFFLGIFMVLSYRQDPVVLRRLVNADQDKSEGKKQSFFGGYQIILQSYPLKSLTFVWSSASAVQFTLIGLWGVPWFSSSFDFTIVQARNSMTVAGLGVIGGAFLGGLIGNFSRGSTRALLISCTGIAGSLVMLIVVAWLKISSIYVVMLSGVIGVSLGMCSVQCNSNLNEVVNRRVIGSVIGAINTVIFSAVVVAQFGSGFILNHFRIEGTTFYSSKAYLITFSVIAILFILSIIPLFRIKSFRMDT